MMQNDVNIINFYPNRLLPYLKRWQELLVKCIVIGVGIFTANRIGLISTITELLTNRQPASSNVSHSIYASIVITVIFLIYKIHFGPYVINKITIDYKKKEINIYYSFLFIVDRSCNINFDDLCFKRKNFQGFNRKHPMIVFYKNNLKVCKLVSKQNGWDIEKVDNLNKKLLEIKNG